MVIVPDALPKFLGERDVLLHAGLDVLVEHLCKAVLRAEVLVFLYGHEHQHQNQLLGSDTVIRLVHFLPSPGLLVPLPVVDMSEGGGNPGGGDVGVHQAAQLET